ncbi:peptidyl-prolyl cis-trans isomerase [Corallincola luteus]|uniref:Peptidyl-prolyl cis-trans isomerase n=2 Tax=Corallincola TaxID=1775176 RepID=A0A368NM51_9GAMM|nr:MULTISPECIES: peptidylprolyl isomerase [Corallincola]RCU50915.1 peptidyl-prolyl cis-trans isomerase [Corallincola holothuriorum]TCI03965.1 peptidyl-prolyl cis-trans isomerase [Corallincola luteus]
MNRFSKQSAKLKPWLQQPWLVFLFVAGVIALFDLLYAPSPTPTIEVSVADKKAIVAYAEQGRGRPLTAEEVEIVLAEHVQEEILLKEAYRLGLNDDAMIRMRLLNKMHFIIKSQVPTPTESELIDYFKRHTDSFRAPPSWRFEQLFFVTNRPIPQTLLVELRSGQIEASPQLTQQSSSSYWNDLPEQGIAARYGAHVAEAIIEVPKGVWQGPFPSPTGNHFIRVERMRQGALPIFEEVRRHVENEWKKEKESAFIRLRVEQLKTRFSIGVTEGSTTL